MECCNCNVRHPNDGNAGPQRMFIKPNEIFDTDAYRKLVTKIDQIPYGMDCERWKRIQINGRCVRNSDNDDSGTENFPPVEVEPICVDKLTINLTVSKANPKN